MELAMDEVKMLFGLLAGVVDNMPISIIVDSYTKVLSVSHGEIRCMVVNIYIHWDGASKAS